MSPALGPSGGMRRVPAFETLDILSGLVSLQAEKGFTHGNLLAIALEPADKGPLVHIPAEPWNRDFACHQSSFVYSAIRSRTACADGCGGRNDGGLQSRAIRRRSKRAVKPADRRIQIVKPAIRQLSGDLGANAVGGERLVDNQEPAGLGDGPANRLDIERCHRPRIDQLNRDSFLSQLFADAFRMVHHQGQCDDRDVVPLADNRCLAELDLVIIVGNRAFHSQKLAVLQKDHRVVRRRARFKSPLAS